MNDFKDIAKLLKPLLRGSVFIVLLGVIGVLAAKKAIQYITPKYESTAKIKLDDSSNGLNNTILFKDFELFPTGNRIATEIEVLKSEELLKKVVEKVDFDVSYFRVGDVKSSEMYHDSPFVVEYESKGENLYGRSYQLSILDSAKYLLTYVEDGVDYKKVGVFGDSLETNYAFFDVQLKNDSLESENVEAEFYFVVNSVSSIVSEIKNKLDLMSIDKDVPVIRISYKDPIPEKTVLVANELAETYIEDYISTKATTAQKTLDFIDQQIAEVKQNLQGSEKDIERYKLKHKVVNIKQQTETGLKKLAQLEIQLANLEMAEKSLEQLNDYVKNGNGSLESLAPQVGFGDLLYTELMKKIKTFETEKEALLKKYQPENEQIQTLEKNIKDLEEYIVKSIENAKEEISTKRASIAEVVATEEAKLNKIPSNEKELMVLERNFLNNQQSYNFLMTKRTEAAIAAQSNISFHRMLQKAKLPKQPTSPNKTLLTFIAGFLGIVTGIILVYAWYFLRNKIQDKNDIEKNSGIPVLGVIQKAKANIKRIPATIWSLANQLILKSEMTENQMLAVTSNQKKEGKSYIAVQLSVAFAEMGYNVLLVDGNSYAPSLHEILKRKNEYGITDYLQGVIPLNEVVQQTHHQQLTFISAGSKTDNITAIWSNRNLNKQLATIKEEYEIVIFDTPAIGTNLEGLFLLKYCDHNLFVLKSNAAKKADLVNADVLAEKYGIKGLSFVLNNVKGKVNHEGYAASNKSVYKTKKTTIKQEKPLINPNTSQASQ